MRPFTLTVNAFLEDSCVLFVAAYLLTRGPLLRFIFPSKSASHSLTKEWCILLSGLWFGLVGATEYGLPNLRYPYNPTILFVTAAVFLCGLPAGVVAVCVLLAANAITPNAANEKFWFWLLVKLGAALTSGTLMRHWFSKGQAETTSAPKDTSIKSWLHPWSPLAAFGAGVLAQSAVQSVVWFLSTGYVRLPFESANTYQPSNLFSFVFTTFANGLGVGLLQFVLRDAHVRSEVESLRREAAHHAAEAEQARAFAAEHQLAALRARVHPHFLFNALTSIAALCVTTPEGAEKSTIALGELMHRVLENNLHELVTLEDEIRDVKAYLEIERYRLGSRLRVEWRITKAAYTIKVPPFSLMTLVENAIAHGIAPRRVSGIGTITITAHQNRPNWLCIAVSDNGVGMTEVERSLALCLKQDRRTHGLHLLDDQLRLLFGTKARVRLFSKSNQGTLVIFSVPLSHK